MLFMYEMRIHISIFRATCKVRCCQPNIPCYARKCVPNNNTVYMEETYALRRELMKKINTNAYLPIMISLKFGSNRSLF